MAVASPRGLVVPVIRDAHELSFAGVEKAIVEMGQKAKDGTISMEDMAGGTFTISNGGVFGSMMSTPTWVRIWQVRSLSRARLRGV